jgi:hypothetical protein
MKGWKEAVTVSIILGKEGRGEFRSSFLAAISKDHVYHSTLTSNQTHPDQRNARGSSPSRRPPPPMVTVAQAIAVAVAAAASRELPKHHQRNEMEAWGGSEGGEQCSTRCAAA